MKFFEIVEELIASEKRIKLGVICGGMSTENEVSCVSAESVIANLDKNKYEIYPIFIDKDGKWYTIANIEKNEKFGTKNKWKTTNGKYSRIFKNIRCNFSSITRIIWRRWNNSRTI